jgi:positive regulator of sigma E activity
VKRWAKASCSVQQGCLSCATTESCAQTIWFWGQNDMNDGLHQNP